MPATMVNSELNKIDSRCRQPMSVSIHKWVKSLSGQGSVAYNTLGFQSRFLRCWFDLAIEVLVNKLDICESSPVLPMVHAQFLQ